MGDDESAVIIGIDLGTTNSAVGVVDGGFPILLADGDGEVLTPSVVWYPADGSEPVVGRSALRAEAVEPERVVRSVKRLIGRAQLDLSPNATETRIPPAIDPVKVSSEILKHLKAIAEMAEGKSVAKAVITVPAYFNDSQRNATKRAAEEAGLKVERMVNEPTAAALAYGLDKLGERSKIAVYDFGGGTFDVSILELSDGVFRVLATNGDTLLGGDDIDVAVVGWIEREIALMTGAKTDGTQRMTLKEAATRAKIELSSKESTKIRLPFFNSKDSIDLELSRKVFEKLAGEIIRKTAACCHRAMSDAGLSQDDISEVILVGGSTRIPAVRALVEQVFGKPPNTSQNPGEAIAVGATIQAGIISGSIQKIVLLDVTPLSLGVETFGGLMNVIIPRNTTIPAKAGEMFTNAVAGQVSLLVRVLQGEREMAKDNWALGEFTVPFEAGPKGSARVGVQFRIDENGILEILARDTSTGLDRIFEIEDVAINVEDSAVEAMIEESITHAFEDVAKRRRAETEAKAKELLSSVDIALDSLADQLRNDMKEEVVKCAKNLTDCLGNEGRHALERAVAELEEVTAPLAELLISQLLGDDME